MEIKHTENKTVCCYSEFRACTTMGHVRICHRSPSPVILWTELGGKPKLLPMTAPIIRDQLLSALQARNSE